MLRTIKPNLSEFITPVADHESFRQSIGMVAETRHIDVARSQEPGAWQRMEMILIYLDYIMFCAVGFFFLLTFSFSLLRLPHSIECWKKAHYPWLQSLLKSFSEQYICIVREKENIGYGATKFSKVIHNSIR